MSEQLIQYCQWKCLELSLEINLDTFSNYSLVGAGSMGEVYRVIKKDTNKTFALKVVPLKDASAEKQAKEYHSLMLDISTDANPKGAFISQVYSTFPHCSSLLFVYEYADGGDLASLRNRRGNLNLDELLFYAAETLMGLEFLASRKICHRLIAPKSVVLSGTGHCKISRLHHAAVCDDRQLCDDVGQKEFKAPEIAHGEQYDECADLFSFGCILYFMFVGESPILTDAITQQISYNVKKKLDDLSCPLLAAFLSKLLCESKTRISCFDCRKDPIFAKTNWSQAEAQSIDAPIITTTRDVSPVLDYIPCLTDMDTKATLPAEFGYISKRKWRQEMLDTVFTMSNEAFSEQTEAKPLRRKLSSSLGGNDEVDEDKITQQDVLLWGICNRNGSSAFNSSWTKRLILLFPNRIEIPSDNCLIPIDEILSVSLGKVKDQKAIQIKSPAREISISFTWKFEMDQWYYDILRVWKNVNRLSKNAPKQLSFRRSLKDEMKRQEKVALAQTKIVEGVSTLDISLARHSH